MKRDESKVMSQKKIKGRGRLVPTRATGVQYEVHYGIEVSGEREQHGRGMRPTVWAKCSLKPSAATRIPDGTYFLHADDGRVLQLKSERGTWHCLTVAA